MSYFELPEPRRERCPFCDNVAGRETEGGVRCAVVSETELTLTFVAPRRQHLGRLLVISKRHAPTLFDLTDEEAAAIMRETRRASRAVTRAFKPDGLTIYQNNGVGAGHEIPHVHVHVVPRYHADDGAIPRKGPVVPYEERAEVAARIKHFIVVKTGQCFYDDECSSCEQGSNSEDEESERERSDQ